MSGAEGAHGRHIENDALLLFRHQLAEDLTRQQRADEVEVENPLHCVGGEVEEGHICAGRRLFLVAPRAVDEDVYLAERCKDGLRCGFDTRLVQHIALHRDGFASLGLNLICDFLRRFDEEIEHGDFDADPPQCQAHRPAQHAAAACHHGDFAFQSK